MKKNFKMELICDYIFLINISDYCEKMNSDCDFLNERVRKLIRIYKKLFFKLNLLNLSFAILEKENKYSVKSNYDVKKVKNRIILIENNITDTLKKAKLNEFERNYVVE